MWKKIQRYSLYWDATDKSGAIYLKLSDNMESNIKHLSKLELAAFGDILRNEDPVWFHSTRGDLSTELIPGDEEERA
jgi:hypothetical protein